MELPAYLIAWSMYLLAALGLLLVVWRITRNTRFTKTKRIVRITVVTILLTPVNIAQQGMWLAPAYLVAVYDWLVGNPDRAMLALVLLGGVFAVLLCMTLLESLLRRLLHLEPLT